MKPGRNRPGTYHGIVGGRWLGPWHAAVAYFTLIKGNTQRHTYGRIANITYDIDIVDGGLGGLCLVKPGQRGYFSTPH